MTEMIINLEGDGILKGKPADIVLETPITVSSLPGGMTSGRPSVAFIFNLPDGRTVLAQTTGRLFVTAARALEARYGKLVDSDIRVQFLQWAEADQESIFRHAIFIAGVSPVGSYSMFRDDMLQKWRGSPILRQVLEQARRDIDEELKRMEQ